MVYKERVDLGPKASLGYFFILPDEEAKRGFEAPGLPSIAF